MCHVASSVSENIYLLPGGFLKLLYLSFKAFQSKLDIDTSFASKMLKTTVLSFRLGFSTLATWKLILKLPPPWSPLIFIWITLLMNGYLMIILLLKKGIKCYLLTMSARSSHFSIPHPSQNQQLSKLVLLPLHNVNFSIIITPPTPFTMLSFDLVVNFNGYLK